MRMPPPRPAAPRSLGYRLGKFLRPLFAGAGLWLLAPVANVNAQSTLPVLAVDYPYPTADKPQSKLWFDQGTWWALLPRATGPSVWERAPGGWIEHTQTTTALKGQPGRADVWFDDDGVTAVAVSDRQMAVLRLTRMAATWQPEVLARLPAPASDVIETATIARDADARWWISATVQGRLYVWHSDDARAWSPPLSLAPGLDVDDICVVSRIDGGIAVIWSDQKSDGVFARIHRDGDPAQTWQRVEVVVRGGRNADDHLNAALQADGTLWIASKNSIDAAGAPQLMLYRRSAAGQWETMEYAPLAPDRHPTRPLVIAAPDGDTLLLGQVVSTRPDRHRSHVAFARVTRDAPMPGETTPMIAPDPGLAAEINDAIGPKSAFPEQGPWIVLASDGDGRVYEADLRALER
jgi:hypothetical protein